MNDIFGIPVEVLDSLPDGQVLLVNRKTWEQMKSAEPTTARPWTGASRMSERMTDWPREIALLKAERDALREKVQRVRDVLGDVGK